jgi:hypothetical protein
MLPGTLNIHSVFQQVLGLVLLLGRTRCSTTRLPSSAAPAHDHAWTGRTERSLPRSSEGCPEHYVASAWSLRTRSLVGIGASCAEAGPLRTDSTRTAADRRRPRRAGGADGAGESALGITEDPGRAAQARPLRQRIEIRRILKRHRIPLQPEKTLRAEPNRRQAGRQRASLYLSIYLYLPLYPGLSRPHTAPRAIPRLPRGGAHPACLGHTVVDIA